MSTKLKALWHMQNGECFYCGRPTWLRGGGESKNDAKARLGVSTTKGLRKREASQEHLRRKADGGGNGIANLVMSCFECNSSRLSTPVLLHLSVMRGVHS